MIEWLPGEETDLVLLPMAARRALDRAGLKLSLLAWQALPLADRERIATLGSVAEVDVGAVAALVEAPEVSAVPEPTRLPEAVRAIDVDEAAWSALGPVARHALEMYCRKGRSERAREVYRAVTSSGASQSSR